MSNEHTVKSYEEELRYLIDSVIKMGSLTESQLVDSMDAVIKVDKDSIGVSIKNNDRHSRAMHGTVRQLISNAIEGVNSGFSKHLEILGVGYNVKSQGNRLVFQLGFSHDIVLELPDGIEADAQKNKLEIKGIDKQLVGQVSAKIRSLKKPEPYKGKGIRYKDEYVRRKQGKTVGGTE